MSVRTKASIMPVSNKTIMLSIPAEVDENLEEKLSRWLENEFHVQTEKVYSRTGFARHKKEQHDASNLVLIWSQQSDFPVEEVSRTKAGKQSKKSYTIEEVFPDSHPGIRLRGLRGKLGITQTEMAKRLRVAQHHISEMENRKRKISLDMAKRIGSEFGVSYKVFL